jgi:hypothetical protein
MPSGSDVLNFAWIYFTSNTHQFGDILDNVDIFVGIKFWQESFAHHFFSPPTSSSNFLTSPTKEGPLLSFN